MRRGGSSWALWVACLLAAAPAGATPLKSTNARSIHVSVNRHRHTGLALRACTDGWRVTFTRGSNALAELIDVTPRTPARTFEQALGGNELFLEAGRFVGGHTYQIQLRRGRLMVARGYVYLPPITPRTRPAQDCPAPQYMAFDGSAPPPEDSGAQLVAKRGL